MIFSLVPSVLMSVRRAVVGAGLAWLAFTVLSSSTDAQRATSPTAPTAAEDPAVIDQAWQKASAKYDAQRGTILKEVNRVGHGGPYRPDWESLQKYEAPEWYKDAKFGIFIHWGVYSVAAFANEYKQSPALFKSFNTTGGELSDEETKAVVELLVATHGGDVYRKRLQELLPVIQERFSNLGWIAVRAVPFMDPEFKSSLAATLRSYKVKLDEELSKNPYSVPIATGTWGGSGLVAELAVHMYFLHRAFPDMVGSEYTLRGLDYVLGTHPVSNVSCVSSVGTQSKLIGYGSNRADYSFVPGGMIPGVVIVQPDYPELKDDWPFLWFENEYVVDTVTTFILAANAANELAR